MKLLVIEVCMVIVGGVFGGFTAAQEMRDENGRCAHEASKGVHACHCVAMTAEIWEEQYEQCLLKGTPQEFEECKKAIPEKCELMDKPQYYGHGADPRKCYTWCAPHHCSCNDSVCPMLPARQAEPEN